MSLRGKKMRKREKKREVRKKKLKIRREVLLKKDLSYPHVPLKKEKEIIFFNNLLPKNYFTRNLKQDSTLERFRKNRSYIEERNT